MQLNSGIDDCWAHLLHQKGKLIGRTFQVIVQDGLVDPEQGVVSREDNRECGKVSLQPRVDCEAACSWIHAGNILHIVNVLLGQLVPVIPVPVIHVLADKGVRPNSPVEIDLRHVHVVQEVDQLLGSWRTIVFPRLLLQRLFQDFLGHLRRVVEVEGHIGYKPLLIQVAQLLIEHESLS